MSLNNTPNNQVAVAVAVAVLRIGLDMENLPTPPHFVLPVELFDEVTSYLSAADVCNLRITSQYMEHMCWAPLFRKLTKDKTIYATFDSMTNFLGMLNVFAWRLLALDIKEVCLLADGFKAPEYGYNWAWENTMQSGLDGKVDAQGDMVPYSEPTKADLDIIDDANRRHAGLVSVNDGFINSGGYRAMLTAVLHACPNLDVLNIRKLKADEHIPGWFEAEKFEKLSFYEPGMNTKDIFYGDWQYDTVHMRAAHSTDEFGEEIVEPNPGPQASFIDDLNAAIAASGRAITTNFIRG